MSAGDYIPYVARRAPGGDQVNGLENFGADTAQEWQFSADNDAKTARESTTSAPETLANSSRVLAEPGYFPDYGKGEDFRAFQRDPGKTLATLARNPETGPASPWLEGLDKLMALRRPSYVKSDDWEDLQFDAVRFDRDWGEAAIEHGWSILEIFGVSSRPWKGRLDGHGLVALLKGRRVLSVLSDRATIDVSRGRGNTYYRSNPLVQSIPIWEAYAGGPDP